MAYNEELCEERHCALDREIKDMKTDHKELKDAINGKFNMIMFGIFGTLLTIIGSLIVVLVNRPIPH